MIKRKHNFHLFSQFLLIAFSLLICFSSIFAQDPTDYQGWFDKGSDLVEEDELEDAIDAFRKAIEFKANDVEALLALADAYALNEE